MLRSLPPAEFECHVVVPAEPPLRAEFEAAGAAVHIVPMTRISRSHGAAEWVAYAAGWPIAVARLVRADPYACTSTSSTATRSTRGTAGPRRRSPRRPHVWHTREIVVQSGPALTRRTIPHARRFATAVICMSTAIADQLPGANTVVIRETADPDEFSPTHAGRFRVAAGIPDDAPLVGGAGRIDTWKGFDVLLDAFAEVAQSAVRTPTSWSPVAPSPGRSGSPTQLAARAADDSRRALARAPRPTSPTSSPISTCFVLAVDRARAVRPRRRRGAGEWRAGGDDRRRRAPRDRRPTRHRAPRRSSPRGDAAALARGHRRALAGLGADVGGNPPGPGAVAHVLSPSVSLPSSAGYTAPVRRHGISTVVPEDRSRASSSRQPAPKYRKCRPVAPSVWTESSWEPIWASSASCASPWSAASSSARSATPRGSPRTSDPANRALTESRPPRRPGRPHRRRSRLRGPTAVEERLGRDRARVAHRLPEDPRPRRPRARPRGRGHADTLPHGSRVTFEPGGQVELSRPPRAGLAAIHAIARRRARSWARRWRRRRDRLVAIGLEPARPPCPASCSPRATTQWSRSSTPPAPPGRTMMRSTAAIQVNLDLGTPEEIEQRWRLTHALGPVLGGRVRQLAVRRRPPDRLALHPPRGVARDRPARARLPWPTASTAAQAWARYALDARR